MGVANGGRDFTWPRVSDIVSAKEGEYSETMI